MHLIFVWVLTGCTHISHYVTRMDCQFVTSVSWMGNSKYPQFIKYRADETMRLKTTNLNIKKAEMKRKPSNLWRILNLCVLSFLNKFHNHFSNRAWPFYVRKVSAIWYLSYSCIWQFTVQSLHYNVKGITLLSNCVELQKWWKDEIVKRKLKNRSLSTYLQNFKCTWRNSIQVYLNRHDGSFCVIISIYAYRKKKSTTTPSLLLIIRSSSPHMISVLCFTCQPKFRGHYKTKNRFWAFYNEESLSWKHLIQSNWQKISWFCLLDKIFYDLRNYNPSLFLKLV